MGPAFVLILLYKGKYHGIKVHNDMSAAFFKIIAHSMRKYDNFLGHEQNFMAMS